MILTFRVSSLDRENSQTPVYIQEKVSKYSPPPSNPAPKTHLTPCWQNPIRVPYTDEFASISLAFSATADNR